VSTAARKARKRAGIRFERTPKTPTVPYAGRTRRAMPGIDAGFAHRTFSFGRVLRNALSLRTPGKKGDR